MKIKVKEATYQEAISKIKSRHKQPRRPNPLLRIIARKVSEKELEEVHFTYNNVEMEKLGKEEPCLILMNHSSFIDLKITTKIFAERPYNIICTSDGFVGKEHIMRSLGCIPTQKFVTDVNLLRDMQYCFQKLKTSVLMYPEASYSFDGTATPLPESVGKCIKMMKAPVVMVRTYGAFSRDPLYNGLQVRKVDVSATVTYLLSPEEIQTMKAAEINSVLKEAFTFDHFAWQQENQIRIDEPFRADHLNRVLFKCPHCQAEGQMEGKGIKIRCKSCGVTYELTEYGSLSCENAEAVFTHIPEWYAWERACVRHELRSGTYGLRKDVDIYMLVDFKQIYHVGEGVLEHTDKGFTLDGCDGALHYEKSPESTYSLYADYYWYELSDMICIGDAEKLFYCFPKDKSDVVAKTRLATEELYRMNRRKKVEKRDV